MFQQGQHSAIYLIIASGFAIFSMFFGSGNLVFPLMLGYYLEGHYLLATMGLLLTGVLVPFLGLYAIMLFQGSYHHFFAKLHGNISALVLPILILSLLGPLGVLPRSINVAYGSFVTLLPATPLWLFGLIMSLVIALFISNRNKIVPVIGFVLTPFLLASLILIIIFSVFQEPTYVINNDSATLIKATSVLQLGITQGYFMMDLLAAFFFANVAIRYLQDNVDEKISSESMRKKITIMAMLLALTLLSVVYAAFVYLGVHYAGVIDAEGSEQSLALIAHASLGDIGGPVVVVAVILATLTTAIALTDISARFLQVEIFRRRLNYPIAVLIILTASLLMSRLEFNGIAALIGPVLEILYPALIALTISIILQKRYGLNMIKASFYITLVITLWIYFF